jgi:hypothetical protein
MLNKEAIDAIQKQIKELEDIRDQLLPNPSAHLSPIFDKIDELYGQLLKELGYSEPNN